MTRSVVLAVVLLLSWAGIAHAQKRVALVIGNSAYSAIQPLANPRRDARLIAATLGDLGFEVVSAIDVDYRAMSKAVQAFGRSLRKAGSDAVGLLYYAGHGIQASGANYLLPVDASVDTEADLRLNALSVSDILAQMKQAGNTLNLVILDACRNNPFQGRFRSATRGLARVEAPSGSLIAYAAAPGQLAADGSGGNSPYAAALAKAMREPGLDVIRMFRRVRLEVEMATGAKQTPWEEQSLRGDFYFVPEASGGQSPASSVSGVVSDEALELSFWNSISDSNSVLAFEAYLQRYPKGTFSELAAIKVAELKRKLAAVVPAAKIEPKQGPCDGKTLVSVGGGTRCLKPGDRFRDCPDCPEMVVVPAGRFTMGSPANEKGRYDDEGPQHEVRIGYDFGVGRFQVTRGQFAAFVRESGHDAGDTCWGWHGKKWKEMAGRSWNDPGFGQGDDHPVTCMSWDDARAYVKWLNGKVGGEFYRLLSEAEWEYAARANATTRFSFGNNDRDLCDHGNGADKSASFGWRNKNCSDGVGDKTAAVGLYKANAFGLNDMHGNVWEWTEDCWHDSYKGAPTDGSAWTGGGSCARRVLRGGSWYIEPRHLRSANRGRNFTVFRGFDSGFRVARTLGP